LCGIAGFWGPPDEALLKAMNACVRHRGPDDDGFLATPWASLGMRRLAIIDIEGGAQPIGNEDGSVQVVYNGEIYNYRELRAELEAKGHRFRTRSDTEVIVHAYEEGGPECFARFNGMWAVALTDGREPAAPRLVLARDHFGIKPLYYASTGRRLLWASEVKSLLQDEELTTSPDQRRMYEYLKLGLHDHTGDSFFTGVRQLPAAHYAVISAAGDLREGAYWEPRLARDGSADPEEFRALFERAVERRLVSEVPVGTCLSGGLDSSTIVCFMAGLLERHVPDAASMGDHLKTFSAVFDGDPIDETGFIQEVVGRTGVEAHFVRPKSEEFISELGRLVWHQEEPIVSTGPYAQWCVMRLARDFVTVLLDGQGGDELLAGYVPYQFVYLRQLQREGAWLRLLREAWAARDVLWPLARRRLLERTRPFRPTRYLPSAYSAEHEPVVDTRVRDDLKGRLLQDLTTFSLPSLLRYEDRNSMAFSIESRVPYLDQELVEWILRQPEPAIIDGGWSRAILRRGLEGTLPEKIRRRRWKVGFTTPEFRWLKKERAWVQGFLRSPAFVARPHWDGLAVADAFDAICDGRLEEHPFIWRAINVEAWLRVFFRGDGAAGRPPETALEAVGDELAAGLLGTPEAREALVRFHPNPGHHLFQTALRSRVYARAPLKSRKVGPGDDLGAAIADALGAERPGQGDILAVSEKAVAVAQGRSLPLGEVRPSAWARWLSRFVRRSPVGIGIAMPETMQLAIEEVGLGRILAAAGASVLARPFGRRGVFYEIAGQRVAAIDGPTPYTIPPSNTHAKRAPAEPEKVAAGLAERFGCRVAIVDANDIGVAVLGSSDGVDTELVRALFRDNPLGQKSEQTPFALLRYVGDLTEQPAPRTAALISKA
jgi:asparagine synthase (glutamine-hydrolysing)